MSPAVPLSDIYPLIDSCAAVIFDNDGTLVDTMPAHHIAYLDALRPHNLTFPLRQFYALAGVPASTIVAQLAAEQGVAPAPLAAIMAARAEALEDALLQVRPVPPAVELLRYARKKGKKVAVASGGERGDVVKSLEACGVGAAGFDAVVTREDVKRGKPDPETFLLAAERIGVEPEQCVGFEDGELGMQSLRAAGITAVDIRELEGYPVPDLGSDAA